MPQLEGAAAVVSEVVIGSATLIETGPSDQMLDLTLTGDGDTAEEQAREGAPT